MKSIYGIDSRSIGAFRVILSCFIALEFGIMVLGNFSNLYSPETGVLGNDFAKDYYLFYQGFRGIFIIHTDIQMKLFVWLIITNMLLLAFGFYPRILAATGSFLLYLFFNRYSVLYFGWEMYASIMLFWLIFLPSGDSFSLFNASDRYSTIRGEVRSPIVFALLFQIGFIYFYNGISKNGEIWMSGKAIDSFLTEMDKTTFLAPWLKRQSLFTSVLSWMVLLFEWLVLPLLFFPIANKKLRYFTAIAILLLHWGIALFADVGSFKYVATSVAVLLMPDSFWALLKLNAGGPVGERLKMKLPVVMLKIPYVLIKITAGFLIAVICISNLAQTSFSKTNDRVKKIIHSIKADSFVQSIGYQYFPPYTFFTQYWHLYSPDPPNEKGYMCIEAITVNNDTLAIFNGVPLKNETYDSKIQHYLFNALLLKRGRNQKDRITEKYLMLREIKLWNRQQANPKMKSLQLVIYSFPYSKKKESLSRIEYKTIDIKYRGN